MSVLDHPMFHSEEAAFAKLESLIWPDGPVCPHCGGKDRVYVLEGVRTKPSGKHPEGVVRHGLKKCGHCRKQFTARVGTVFESSHIPLHLWLQAVHLLCSSKKGISSHQLHRILRIKYQSAWFMSHRIREAMRSGTLAPPMAGGGGIVEVDETFIGAKPGMAKRAKKPAAYQHKYVVLTLVERGGSARSFHIDKAKQSEIIPVVRRNVSKEAAIVTDDARHYKRVKVWFADHQAVNHTAGEYTRGEVHTNTVEGYFSIFKRGMKGVYQHCSEKHLHRYLAEFDFRYSNRIARGIDDHERTVRALMGIIGKRLTYRDSSSQEEVS